MFFDTENKINIYKKKHIEYFEYVYKLAQTKGKSDPTTDIEGMALNFDLELDPQDAMQCDVDKSRINLFKEKITPIGLLACQGDHEAVSYLFSIRESSSKCAMEGYELGKHLLNEEQRQALLNTISARKALEDASEYTSASPRLFCTIL